MELEIPKRRFRMILDFKCQFPEKLLDVANDGQLIYWNDNGSVSVTSEEAFEENVMKWYPGFLQIPSFLNLKRLFREYGFDREIDQNGELQWSHKLFVRGRRELVKEIKTRRKTSFRTVSGEYGHDGEHFVTGESAIIPTEKHRRYSVRKRRRTVPFVPPRVDHGGGGDYMPTNHGYPYVLKPPPTIFIEEGGKGMGGFVQGVPQMQQFGRMPPGVNMDKNNNSMPKDFNTNQIMANYAEKEFNEEEYHQWIAKKRKLDREKIKTEKGLKADHQKEQKSNEYWWMYENKTGGDIVQTVNLSTKQSTGPQGEMCTPCGFCKCCSAISNYVHLFGEIPENIQVIDYLEEVVPTSSNTTDAPSTGVTQAEMPAKDITASAIPANDVPVSDNSATIQDLQIKQEPFSDKVNAADLNAIDAFDVLTEIVSESQASTDVSVGEEAAETNQMSLTKVLNMQPMPIGAV